MNTIVRNILAVVTGILIGSAVNMGIITISGIVIPPPEGIDPADMESLKAGMHLFETKHFLFPFLAHSLGTLVGAMLAALIAASHPMKFAFGIGFFFMIGGIINILMLPSPLWFTITDLALAYIPMAWFGSKLADALNKKK